MCFTFAEIGGCTYVNKVNDVYSRWAASCLFKDKSNALATVQLFLVAQMNRYVSNDFARTRAARTPEQPSTTSASVREFVTSTLLPTCLNASIILSRP